MEARKMKVTGLCVYCGKPATHTCSLCGALVCDMHYNADKGICIACAQGKKAKK
ncbi:hypothetical protein GF374_00605 [Candidatus Woesearchaeota archaeon]|nr:hypothetical protein [Candidatus Woesearchaeota archaeon]